MTKLLDEKAKLKNYFLEKLLINNESIIYCGGSISTENQNMGNFRES